MNLYTRRTFGKWIGKAAAFCEMVSFRGSWLFAGTQTPSSLHAAVVPEQVENLRDGWSHPLRTYRPHTRWWWPGDAVTHEGIVHDLDQMRQQGIGGVEICSTFRMYTKGNLPYLSKEFLEMVSFTIQEAKRRDMEVALTFGPGWSFGGFWVPPTERSKALTQSWVEISGPGVFEGKLPAYKPGPAVPQLDMGFHSDAPDENQIVAVVAGRVTADRLDAESMVDLTGGVQKDSLRWEIPDGVWRLMAFRLQYTCQQNQTTWNFPQHQWVVDHFSRSAMKRYCDYLGGEFYRTFGSEFGETLDTLFCDSFEIKVHPGTLLWSNTVLEEFLSYKGYDLTRYLPAIWWDIGELTPKIRYDVNDLLGHLGLDITFKSFIDWCSNHRIAARIQPYYRFTEEIIKGAGVTPRPEMELTTARFAVVSDPRKAVAAGGHLYGRRIISAEAYTFLHMERYRTTLEEMKIATDAFLRDGVTQFYNHGYLCSPEAHVAPSRDVPWANRISPWNPWWKHYRHLSEYIARCCYLLRQGEFAGDILVYSPQSSVWTRKVLFENEQRIMPYGDVGHTLVASGYDYDPVNDDILQNHARFEDGCVKVRNLSYRFMILPGTTAVPVATMEAIRQFVMSGGIVIGLDKLPTASVGLKDHAEQDIRVKQIVRELFGPDGRGGACPGGGRTYYISDYKIPDQKFRALAYDIGNSEPGPMAPIAPPQKELLRALREHLDPDFAIAEDQVSNGLTFLHRRIGTDDIYFVTNLQQEPSRAAVTFRVAGKNPEFWEPMSGEIHPVLVYQAKAKAITVPLHIAPYASTCIVFRAGSAQRHLRESSLEQVREVTGGYVKGIAGANSEVHAVMVENGHDKIARAVVSNLPEPLAIDGAWSMVLDGYGFDRIEKPMARLESWTKDPKTSHFSGIGCYFLDFYVPERYVSPELEIMMDLGKVGEVAEVILNGRSAGVSWMRPYRLDVTELLLSGANRLEIRVTNTLINYVSGLDRLPDVPADLIKHFGTTANSYTTGTEQWEQREKGFHPLPVSGLIGPVKLVPYCKVTLTFPS